MKAVGEGKEKEMEKGKGKERWKEDSLRKVGPTDTQVILYSVQCYALHSQKLESGEH